MDTPTLLQTGPETFLVLTGRGERVTVTLPLQLRRGLGLEAVPPLTVATEIVRFLHEHGDRPDPGTSLAAAAGRYPGFVEELRSRLA